MTKLALILTEECGIEFYTVAATGESGISVSGLAVLCGVTKQSISKLVSGVSAGKAMKALEAFIGTDIYLFEKGRFKKYGFEVTLLKWEFGKAILQHYYQQGRTTPKGAELLGMPIIMRKPRKEPRLRSSHKALEHACCKRLAKKENGLVEVQTLAGRIDVLTASELIEVKEVKGWKAALGQALVYGHYYPSHQKRIHLFGETQEIYLAMVEGHCSKYDVIVTWEA